MLPIALALSLLSVRPSLPAAQQPDLSVLPWRLLGPSNPGGRAWSIVGVPSDPKTFYVTTAGGGLWKSDDNGTTLRPVLDRAGSASTGAVAIAPSDPRIVWVGTGEPASTRVNSWGDGVYRSMDAGRTWEHRGLADTHEIGAVVIDPRDPATVYVGALGHLWGVGGERGVYKTTDGGSTWKQVLAVNATTGCIDLVQDPKRPDTLYAAMWQRRRWGGGDLSATGPGSGIYKTTDAGATWVRLGGGLPPIDMGKIQLAVAYGNSDIVYAAILTANNSGGVYRSTDGGMTWQKRGARETGYYYDRIRVDPSNDDGVLMPTFDFGVSTDGAATFSPVNLVHVHNDLHDVWIDPHDPQHLLLCGDGGVFITYNRGATWQHCVLPIAQFYAVAADDQWPYHAMGGIQDTGHWRGPSNSLDEEGITARDWWKLRFTGDGMGIAPSQDGRHILMVQEFGNLSALNLDDWSRSEISPGPAAALRAHGATHPVRYDWTPAFAMSPGDPDACYLGSNYLFRINWRTGAFKVISPDLSRQQDRVVAGEHDGYHGYGALFSVAESPLGPATIWAGADDGPVWVTSDAGAHWADVTRALPGLPGDGIVSSVEPSHFAPRRAYVAVDRHTRDDMEPYAYVTDDLGATWRRIDGGLPRNSPVYVVREDPDNPRVLYAGTEFGPYASLDAGATWLPWRDNLAAVAVHSIVVQRAERKLVIGTFGRGIYEADVAALREWSPDVARASLHVFSPVRAVNYRQRETYGDTIEQLNGDMFFRTPNPPIGAWIEWWQTGSNAATVEVRDSGGRLLRTLGGPAGAGLHRVLWDLAPDGSPTAREGPLEQAFRRRAGPGSYRVTVSVGAATSTVTVDVVSEQTARGQVRQ